MRVFRVLSPLLLLLMFSGCRPRPMNVLLISMDTTRADHLGCYGHDSIKTPNIDRLAASSQRFAHCFSAVPVTLPSHTTILSGRYPIYHSVRDNGTFHVPADLPTLASILAGRGWTTMGVIGSFPITKAFGLSRGFQYWDEKFPPRPDVLMPLAFEQRTADAVTKTALKMLDDHGGEPFFLFVHYFDDHRPWQAPALYARQYPQSPYDAEIAYLDSWIGELLEGLRKRHLDENTVIVLTGDHGEGLSDHEEETHSMLLYNGTLHVPLLLHAPGVEPGVIDRPVSSADIAPTVLEVLGISDGPEMDGFSLLHDPGDRLIYSESLVGRLSHGWNDLRAAVVGGRKFILGVEPELYDVESDEGERNNLASAEPGKVRKIRKRLLDFIATHQGPYPLAESFSAADSETVRKLRALGYVVSERKHDELEELGPITPEGDPRPKLEMVEIQSIVRSLVNEHRLPLALEILGPFRRKAPEDIEMIRLELMIRILGNQPGEAVGCADLLEKHPLHESRDLKSCALAHRLAGDERGSLRLIDEAMEAGKDEGLVLLKIDILDEMGKDQEADTLLAGILKASPCSEEALWTRARRLRLSGAPPGSLGAVYSEIAHCAPDDPRVPYNLGNLRFEAGDDDSAQKYYETALEKSPSYIPAHFGLALVLRDSGEAAAAAKELEEVIRNAPINSTYGQKAAALMAELGIPDAE